MQKKFHVKLFLLLVFPILAFSQRTSTRIEVKPLPILPPIDPSIISFLTSFPEIRSMPLNNADWYYWTNYSRQRPIAFWDSVVTPLLKVYPQLNTQYASSLKKDLYQIKSLPLIKPNSLLTEVATKHAGDLAKNSPGKLSHNSTNGTPFERRIFSSGIQNCAAENLSLGPFNTVLSLVFLYLDEGLPDVGHRKNLLSPFYSEMGIGIATTKGNNLVVVQDFACGQSR